MTVLDLTRADGAAEQLRNLEWILPVGLQAAIDMVLDGYEHRRNAANRLLDACDKADKAVEADNYSDRRALPTGLIRDLLANEKETNG